MKRIERCVPPLAIAIAVAALVGARPRAGSGNTADPPRATSPAPVGAARAPARGTPIARPVPSSDPPLRREFDRAVPGVRPAPDAPARLDPSRRDSLRGTIRVAVDAEELLGATEALGGEFGLEAADVEILLHALDGPAAADARVVAAILRTLARSPRLVPIDRVEWYAVDHPDEEVRREALHLVADRIGGSGGDRLLRHAAELDPVPENRREAVALLSGHLEEGDFLEAARLGLDREIDPAVRTTWLELASIDPLAGEAERGRFLGR